MFRLVVLSALFAATVAKPGYLNGGAGVVGQGLVGHGLVGHGLVGAGVVGAGVVGAGVVGAGVVGAGVVGTGLLGHGEVPLPGAVSTISRTDVHGPEIAIPVHSVQPVVSHAPIVSAPALTIPQGPIAHGPIALPSAVSHQSRYDVYHPGHQLVHSIQNVPVNIHVPTIHGGYGGHY